MRILFIHTPADLYGASRSLLRLTSRLAHDRHQVWVVLPVEGTLAGPLRAAGVEVILDPSLAFVSRQTLRRWKDVARYPVRLLLSCLRLWVVLRRTCPDLVHTNTALIPPGGIVTKLLGIPHVCHVREIFFGLSSFWRVYQWFLYVSCRQILCVSDAVAKQFHPKIRRKKVRVLHNGFPADEFGPVSLERRLEFRKRYGLKENRLVGLVGRIKFGRKGQDVFVKAAALLRVKFPDVKFLCIGSPFPGNEDHLCRLNALVAELQLKDAVVYTGDVDDIKAAYAELEVSVQSATWPEPFGGTVIESMAMGKPIVASAVGGTPEQIENGRSGLLFEPGDEFGLAAGIDQLLSQKDFSERLGHNARERFEQKFEFERFFRDLESLYFSLLKAGKEQSATSLYRLVK